MMTNEQLTAKTKFDASHSEILGARGKMAIFLAGGLLVSGTALADIHTVRSKSAYEIKTARTEHTPVLCPISLASDTITTEPHVFDKVTLEKMLTEIAAAHHVSVEFQNDEAKQLRFHFVWKREDSLDRTVEKLNTFERVNIVVENKKLIVK